MLGSRGILILLSMSSATGHRVSKGIGCCRWIHQDRFQIIVRYTIRQSTIDHSIAQGVCRGSSIGYSGGISATDGATLDQWIIHRHGFTADISDTIGGCVFGIPGLHFLRLFLAFLLGVDGEMFTNIENTKVDRALLESIVKQLGFLDRFTLSLAIIGYLLAVIVDIEMETIQARAMGLSVDHLTLTRRYAQSCAHDGGTDDDNS